MIAEKSSRTRVPFVDGLPVPPPSLPGFRPAPYNSRLRCGAIAQLGERLHGMQEVSGSIPLSSTIRFSPQLPRPHRLEA